MSEIVGTRVQDAHCRGISDAWLVWTHPRATLTAVRMPVQRCGGMWQVIMVDGEIRLSTGSTVAAVAWGVVLGLLVTTWMVGSVRLGVMTIVAGQMAALVTVRQLLVQFCRVLRNGYELGRDSVSPMPRR